METPSQLTNFINSVNTIQDTFSEINPALNNFERNIIFLNIKNKIIGRALESLADLEFNNWNDLRSHLIATFKTKTKSVTILNDLLKIKNIRNPNELLELTKNKFSSFKFRLGIEEDDVNKISTILSFAGKLVVNNFISVIDEPYRNNLATRNPKTINEIQLILQNDFHHLNQNMNQIPQPIPEQLQNTLPHISNTPQFSETSLSTEPNPNIGTALPAFVNEKGGILYKIGYINNEENQILIQKHNKPTEHQLTKLFGNKQRFIIKLNENNITNDIIKFVNENLEPRVYYYCFAERAFTITLIKILRVNFNKDTYRFIHCKGILQDKLTPEEQRQTIQSYHVHRKENFENYLILREKFYWPNMFFEIQNYVNNCNICQQNHCRGNPYQIRNRLCPGRQFTRQLPGTRLYYTIDVFGPLSPHHAI